MVYVKDIMAFMNEVAPIRLVEEWDNCGLIVGDPNQQVNRVLVALEGSKDVIQYAIDEKIDLILTHHPLMIQPILKVNMSSLEGVKIINLIKNNISLYAAHTNLDKAIDGMNVLLGQKIGLNSLKVLNNSSSGYTEEKEEGFGAIGYLENPMSLDEYAKYVKNALGLKHIHIVGDKKSNIQKVAFCSGSGMSFMKLAIKEKVDVFLSGDLKYHDAMYAYEQGLNIIDGTHFATENIMVERLSQRLMERFKDIKIIQDTILTDPIITI